MKLEVSELGPVKRAVRIEVPAEDVAKRFRDVYADLRSQVHIPGFRPGKAPLALLEKRYAKAVEDDVVRSLVPEYYQKAMEQAGFTPVAVDLPPLERIKIKDGTPLVFTTTVEIKPVFELREYKGITLKQDKRAITEEELDKAMQVLRQQHAQIEVVTEDRGIVEGDYVQVHIEQVEGPNQPAGFKPESHLFRVGDKTQFYGLTLDGVVLGKKKGEGIEVSHEGTGTARGMVQTIKQKVLPELDDEFAKDLGDYKTLAELREKVRTQLEQSLKRDIEETYKDQIMKRLVDLHHFDIPESLVQRELDAMVQSERTRRHRVRHSRSQGESGHQEEEFDVRKFREESLPAARQRVTLGLVLEAIAQKEGLAVTDADIEYECRQMAHALRVDVAEVVKMLRAGGEDAIEDLKSRILAEKALQFVYEKAIIQL